MPPLTRPALPWPPALCRPKTGTHHCRCIPPHDCPHNATQNPSWCFPPVFLFCSGAFPVNTVSHNSDTIKRTFKRFCGFLRKKKRMLPSLLTLYTAIFLGDQVFGSPRSAAFPQETGAGAAVFRHAPSCENGIAERPQTLRYPEIKNKFSADNGYSKAEALPNHPAVQSIILPRPSHGRGSLSAHSAPRSGNRRRRCR